MMLEAINYLCYNICIIIHKIHSVGGGVGIRKLDNHHKEWLEKQNIKKQKLMSREKMIREIKGKREFMQNNMSQTIQFRNNISANGQIIITAPSIFSIEKNPEETIEFFNKILRKRNEHKIGTHFYINTSDVINVSVDALMYLIAIISDTKYNSALKYRFSGNFPENEEARKVFAESGFLSFVKTDSDSKIRPKTNSIQIISGNNVDSPVAGEVCEFVQTVCKCLMTDTIPLYNVLVELMGNTKQHAYDEQKAVQGIANFWYLFAEEKENSIDFVFLDTGLGIPTTVSKRFGESIPLFNKDSDFIKSALNGDFRTQTLAKNRGKGLPQISESFKSGILRNVFVYSGKGCCILNNTTKGDYLAIEFKNKIFGTLFCWQVKKKREC